MSSTGLYQVVVTATNPQSGNISIPSRLYLSSNSGSTFNQIIELPYIDDNNYSYFGGVSMSGNGKYISASVLDNSNIDDNFNYIYISSNYGSSWEKIYNDSNGLPFKSLATSNTGFLNLNNAGQYQILTGINQLFINDNYGL